MPDWFGIEEDIEHYIDESAEQIFFAAIDDETDISFLLWGEVNPMSNICDGIIKERK